MASLHRAGIAKNALPEDTPVATALATFAELLWLLTWIGLASGIVVLALADPLRRRMRGVH